MTNWLQKINIHGRFAEISKRFPLVMIFAFVTTFTLIFAIDDDQGRLFRWPVAGFIGFLAALLWSLYCEVRDLSKKVFISGTIILLILLGIYYMMIPTGFSTGHTCFWLATIGLSIVLHLLISLVPYIKNYNTSHFTKYNVALFNSYMQSALYAFLAYIALSLAILALDQLFNLEVKSMFYFRLFIFITGIVQTTLYLSEIPDRFDESPSDSPKSIYKVIVAYLFIPVTILYALILYAYLFRLMLTDHTMVEWTYVMVLWYLSLGVLTWLLSGYLDKGDKSFISIFRKWFYVLSLLPLLMLFFSVYKNIEKSGINEEFYFSALAAVVISLVFLYFLVSKNKDYRVWPIAGVLFCLIGFWSGPFSACKVPVLSQQKKLVHKMEMAGMIQNGVFVLDTLKKYPDSAGIINQTLYFLESRNALGYLKDYDKNNILKSPVDSIISSQIIKTYGLNYFNPPINNTLEYIHPEGNTYDITGFDLMIPIYTFENPVGKKDYFYLQNNVCKLIINGQNEGEFNVSDFVKDLCRNPQNSNMIDKDLGEYSVRLIITNVYATLTNESSDALENLSLSGYAFIRVLEKE